MIPPIVAAAEAPRQMVADLAARELRIQWPDGFAPEQAELFAHNEVHISAQCEIVWQHIVDVSAWSDWYPNAWGIRLLDGARVLAPGARWNWTTFGLGIESRVDRFVPGHQLSWFGYPPGEAPAFYHAWLLEPSGSGCRVVMDEAGIGAGAEAFRVADESRMHRGHELWLAALKWIAEGR